MSFNGNSNFNQNSVDYGSGGAIYTSHNVLLTFNRTNNFTSNLAKGAGASGGAIYTSHNVVLTFNGINSFINNSASYKGGAIYTSSNNALLEPTTSLATQQNLVFCSVVVQSVDPIMATLYLSSMEQTTSLATQHTMVVMQSMYKTMSC